MDSSSSAVDGRAFSRRRRGRQIYYINDSGAPAAPRQTGQNL